MIGSLRGTLVDRDTDGAVLIEVAGTGLGYRAVMGPTAAFELGDLGGEVFIWVHHHIREDTQCLYGFVNRDERATFEALLGAHGVGPALALAILSVHRPAELSAIVAAGDVAGLCLVPGVGKKTAERLLIELRSRLEPGVPPASDTAGGRSGDTPRADVQAALEGLGYRADEIAIVLRVDAVRDADDAEAGLREALRHLGSKR